MRACITYYFGKNKQY